MARLTDARIPSALYGYGSTALQLDSSPVAVAEIEEAKAPRLEFRNEAPVARAVPRHAAATQQTLFASRESSRIVAINGEEFHAPPLRKAVDRTRQKKRTVSTSYIPQQGVLEFVPVQGPQPRKLATSVEAVIYCEHPVASMSHRMIAGAYDFGLYLTMLAAFAGVIIYGCEGITSVLGTPVVAGILGATAAILALVYEALFLATTGSTPGMRWAGLRLVNFDGRRPAEKELKARIIGGAVSLLPAGIGLMWAWLDEEQLTWQDHISHSFPTPSRN